MIYLILTLQFFKVGLLAFGGGLATLPFLYELSAQYGWMSEDEIGQMIAVSQASPGPIGVNMATYAGFTAGHNVGGFWGGLLGAASATFGLTLPAFMVTFGLAGALKRGRDHPLVVAVFSILRPAVTGLIAFAGLQVMRVALLSSGEVALFERLRWLPIALFIILLVAHLRFKKLHPVLFIVIAGFLGVLLKF